MSLGSGKGGDGVQSLGKVVGQLVDKMENIKGMKLHEKISQIRINQEDISSLRKKVDSLEILRTEVVKLDEKASQLFANVDDLRQSVDENHTKFEIRHEETHIKSNRNWENIELIWDEIRNM